MNNEVLKNVIVSYHMGFDMIGMRNIVTHCMSLIIVKNERIALIYLA